MNWSTASIDLKGKRVVAVCTGHGLKDPDIVTREMPKPQILAAELGVLEDYLAGGSQA